MRNHKKALIRSAFLDKAADLADAHPRQPQPLNGAPDGKVIDAVQNAGKVNDGFYSGNWHAQMVARACQ